jgi:hypothetical protein
MALPGGDDQRVDAAEPGARGSLRTGHRMDRVRVRSVQPCVAGPGSLREPGTGYRAGA